LIRPRSLPLFNVPPHRKKAMRRVMLVIPISNASLSALFANLKMASIG
jgi:hypothetical protein